VDQENVNSTAPISLQEEKIKKLNTHKKMSIIRDFMVKNPDFKRYGYLRDLSKMFLINYNTKVSERMCSYYIDEIRKQWAREAESIVTKQHITRMYLNLYENSKNCFARIQILQSLCRMEGLEEAQKVELTASENFINLIIKARERREQLERIEKEEKEIKDGEPQ